MQSPTAAQCILLSATLVILGTCTARAADDVSAPPMVEIKNPVIHEYTEYYEITGSTEHDLRDAIRQRGIESGDGYTYDSETRWGLTCSHTCEVKPGGCTCCSPTVTLEITYHYPKWVPPATASPQLVEKWNTYIRNLIEHESGHSDIAIRQANELARGLSRLPPVSSCSELERRVREMNRDEVKKARALQDEYDAKTAHGLSQNAILK